MAEPINPERKFQRFQEFLFDTPASIVRDTQGNAVNFVPTQRGALTTFGRALTGFGQGLLGNVVEFPDDTAQEIAFERIRQKQQEDAMQNILLSRALGIEPPGTVAQGSSDVIGAAPAIPPISGSGQEAFESFRSSQGGIPQTGLGVTGARVGGVTLGTTPQDQAKINVATSVETQEQKEAAKKARQTKQSIRANERFINLFVESETELTESFPEIGKSNIAGFVDRAGAKVVEKFGALPITTAAINRIKITANKQARTIEGGRVTNEDREVYANGMADAIKFPSTTNIINASEAMLDMYDGVLEGDNASQESADKLKDIARSYLNSDSQTLRSIGLRFFDNIDGARSGFAVSEEFADLSTEELIKRREELLKGEE